MRTNEKPRFLVGMSVSQKKNNDGEDRPRSPWPIAEGERRGRWESAASRLRSRPAGAGEDDDHLTWQVKDGC